MTCLQPHVVRQEEQRAGRSDREPILPAQLVDDSLERAERRVEIRPPDAATIDDPGVQHFVGRESLTQQIGLVPRRADEIEADAVHRQRHYRIPARAKRAEVGLQHDLRPRARGGKRAVDLSEERQLPGSAILDQARLVDLDPLSARRGQICQQLLIDRHDLPDMLGDRELVILAEQHKGDRPDQDRCRPVADSLAGLTIGIDRSIAGAHRGRPVELGDEIVVVRVEPLRHLERRGVVATSSHRRVGCQ